MMSVPYNLNSYSAYLAVGVDNMYLNSSGLFDQLYYYSGPFERAPAGNLVEFTPEGGKGLHFFTCLSGSFLLKCVDFSVMIRGTMTPDTYKPILRVSILPIDKNADGFHAYSSSLRLCSSWTLLISFSTLWLLKMNKCSQLY